MADLIHWQRRCHRVGTLDTAGAALVSSSPLLLEKGPFVSVAVLPPVQPASMTRWNVECRRQICATKKTDQNSKRQGPTFKLRIII
jgi:hypothetical protein